MAHYLVAYSSEIGQDHNTCERSMYLASAKIHQLIIVRNVSQYVADMAGDLFTATVRPFPAPNLQPDADKGRVLPGFTTTVSSVLSAAIELLAEFDLLFTDIRLMQRATETIIAGSAVTSLLPGVANFMLNDIDFFARIACGLKIIRFLQMNNYSVDSTHYSYHDHVNDAAGVAITSSSLMAFRGDLGHFQRIWMPATLLLYAPTSEHLAALHAQLVIDRGCT
ncbi:hypothetical protein C8R43DRAFT_1200897 [Mycena crocata]|nr:hypothetical protein C8R43DRAFT_1200897 [Mycena crocata]